MIKSPLRYPGGKSKAIKIISKVVPDFEEYREPFVGGGSLFVYLKQKYPNRKFWINDIYKNLIHFWKTCRDNPETLIQKITYFRENYQDGKSLHKYLLENIDSFSNIDKAAAFFVFNRITFSGTTESGGYSNAAFQKRFTRSSIDRVKLFSELLDNVSITNNDYSSLLEQPGEDVFIFLDPPYHSAEKSALYGKNGAFHKCFDHKLFAETMSDVKHKWLITYDDSRYIRDLFSYAHITPWELTYGMRNVNKHSDKTGKELFISNYPISLEDSHQLTLFEKKIAI